MAKVSLTFDTDIARLYDTNSAIILQNIEFWQIKNQANGHNLFEGKYWVYNSVSAWNDLFDFLSTKQIRTCLKKLEQASILETGNFNKMGADRTKWYTSTRIAQMGNCNLPNGKLDLPERENGFDQSGKPIPDIKPNISPNKVILHETEVSVNPKEELVLFPKEEKKEEKKVPPKKEKLSNDVVFPIVKKLSGYFPEDITSKLSRNDKLKWSETIEKLIRLDEYTEDQIELAVKTAREDKFWKKQFLSISKLRKKDGQDVKYIQVFLNLKSSDTIDPSTGDNNFKNQPTIKPVWKK